MLRKVKEFLNDHKYLIIGGAALSLLLYFGSRYNSNILDTSTSKFIAELRYGKVTEVIVEG